MDHRATSLKFLTSTGLIPVKVMPGQKDPHPDEWDPRRIANRDHSLTIAELQRSDKFNIGALFHGKWVDLDVDTTNPFVHAALDVLLPPTPYVWGRKSKPRSHRVYCLVEAFDRGPWSHLLQFFKKLVKGEVDDQSYSIEVRGGKPENGLFTVLPGSYRKDVDEHVLWDREIDPTVSGPTIEAKALIRLIRLALVAAMIAPHWVEGTRNDISLAFAGVLWRIRKASMAILDADDDSEVPPDIFVVTEDDAKVLFRCIMKIAHDDKNDERSRLLNLSNTWKKLDKDGGNVTGGRALATLIGDSGSNIVRKVYRLLSDGDNTEAIEALAEQYVIWYGQGLLVDLELVHSHETAWMTKQQAQNSMGGESIRIGDNKISKVNLLFGSKLVNKVYGLTFDPTRSDVLVNLNGSGRLMVNQWSGFATEPCPQRVSNEEVSRFTDYVRDTICGTDLEAYRWTMAWIADIFQNPGSKPGTALVIVGNEGAGKSFLGEHFIGPMIGSSHYAQVNSTGAITDKFNKLLDNKLFILCDESKVTDQRADASTMRGILTGPTIWIEPKGINRYEKPCHFRVLFTSNKEHNPLFISSDRNERRFTVLKVNNDRIGDRSYWNDMLMYASMMRPKIMRWLMDYQFDPDILRRPYDTKIKREIQRVGLDIEVSWILARVTAGFPLGEHTHRYWYQAYNEAAVPDSDRRTNTLRRDIWPDRVVLAAIEDDYRDFVRAYGKSVYSGSVTTTIRKVLPPGVLEPLGQQTVRYVDTRTGQVVQNRVRLYTWPTSEEIVGYLRERYGALVETILEEAEHLKDLGGPPKDKEREY